MADLLRRRVWDEMLIAEMRSSYFAELVSKYQSREKWLRVLTLVASSGAAAAVLSSTPPWFRLGLPIIAAVASFWLLLSQYGSYAMDASSLHAGWNEIHMKYERLWNHLDSEDAESRFDGIYESANPLSKTGTKFRYDGKRLAFWLDHAAQIAMARYA